MAITTDWLTTFGGAERVLAELVVLYPGAPIHTTVYEPAGLLAEYRGWNVRPSFMQQLPFARKHYRWMLPLMPIAFESFDMSGFDVVLTTASACAKGVITPPDVPNVCYCHSPPRYLWDQFHEQTRGMRGQLAVGAVASAMRVWDRAAADRVDLFIANSETVAARIRRYYRREPVVIHPPVDTQRFQSTGDDAEDFLLVVARLVPYKRIDLAVDAATRTGRRLVVVGEGPELSRLRARAGPTVTFLGRQTDQQVAKLYARCRAFLFPGKEDFGIAPVEAQASGRPVVAFGEGGATETVIDGETGIFFDEQSVDALIDGIEQVEEAGLEAEACRANALRFDAALFRARISAVVADVVHGRRIDAPSIFPSRVDVGQLVPH